jgi:hypothetical protein
VAMDERQASSLLCLVALTYAGLSNEMSPTVCGDILGHVGVLDGQLVHPTDPASMGVGAVSRWNLDVMATVLRDYSNLDWYKVATHLDQPNLVMPDQKALKCLVTLFRAASGLAFPVRVLFGPWENKVAHLSFFHQAIGAPPEVITFEASGRMQEPFDDAPDIPLGTPNKAWLSIDLISTLLSFSETSLWYTARSLFDFPVRCCPELLVCGLASVEPTWSKLRSELLTILLPMYFKPGRSPHARAVIKRIWRVNPRLMVEAFVEAYKSEATVMVVHHTLAAIMLIPESQQLVLSSDNVEFVVALAAAASDREQLPNLEKFLSEKMNAADNREAFARGMLSFVHKHAGAAKSCKAPGDVLLSTESLAVILKILSSDHSVMQSGLGMEVKQAIDVYSQRFPDVGTGSSPDAIEEMANSYFQKIYTSEQSIGDVIEMLKRFKSSRDLREQEIFACMIRNLFDEYRFFHKYPEKELRITGILFGTLIQHQLVTSLTLGVALRYVLEALRRPPGNGNTGKWFRFGMFALEQFKARLHEWPQYCSHIVQIPHLRQNQPELVAEIERAMARQPDQLAMDLNGQLPPPSPQGASQQLLASQALGMRRPDTKAGPGLIAGLPYYPDSNRGEGIDTLVGLRPPASPMQQGQSSLTSTLPTSFALDEGRRAQRDLGALTVGSQLGLQPGPTKGTGLLPPLAQQPLQAKHPTGAQILSSLNQRQSPGLTGMYPGARTPQGFQQGSPVIDGSPSYGASLAGAMLGQSAFELPPPQHGQEVKTMVSQSLSMQQQLPPAQQQQQPPQPPQPLPPGQSQAQSAAQGGGVPAEIQPGTPNAFNRDQEVVNLSACIDKIMPGVPETSTLTPPQESIVDRIYFIINNVAAQNIDTKAAELRELIQEENHTWLAHYMVQKRISSHANLHSMYLAFIDKIDSASLTRAILLHVLQYVSKLLRSSKIITNTGDRSVLKNLGSFLGQMTIARNKPLLHRQLDLKELLYHAYETGRLFAVTPFVAKVLECAEKSKIFRPPNPWVMGLVGVMAELYQVEDLKINIKFEIDLLLKKFSLKIDEVPFVDTLRNRLQPKKEKNPDFNVKAGAGAPMMSPPQPPALGPDVIDMKGDLDGLGEGQTAIGALDGVGSPPQQPALPSEQGAVAGVIPQAAFQDQTVIPNLAAYVTINAQLSIFSQMPQLKRVVPLAVDRAIREIIQPVVERSVTIACITSKELIVKDFAFEPDDNKMRKAAHLMVSSLAGSLALVTCKEPLRVSIGNHLRNLMSQANVEQSITDQVVQQCSNDNLELGCMLIEKAATEKAMRDIDEALSPTLQVPLCFAEEYPFVLWTYRWC